MVFFRCAASLSVAVILSLLSTSAEAAVGTTTTYGTASGESGPNYTGGTIGVSSTVRLNDGATVSGTGIIDNGVLQFNQTAGNTLVISTPISGTGTLTLMNSGTLQLTGSNSYTGVTTLLAGELTLGSANAIGSSGTIAFSGGALQATASNTTDYSARFSSADNQKYAIDSNSQDLTLASNLTSSGGSFTKLGSGTVTLTGVNTFTSGSVQAGLLQGSAASLATSGTFGVAAGTEVRFTGNATDSWAGLMAGSGTFTKLGAGTLTLTGSTPSANSTGTLLISNGAVQATTDTIRRDVVDNANLVFAQTTTGTYAKNITGTGAVSLTGSGTVTFSGTGSYSGGTTISAGRLIGTTSSLQGAITNNAAVSFDQTTTGTYSGTMTGSGALTKAGSGTVTLSGANTYSGGTIVAGGSLVGTTSSLQGNILDNAAVTFDQSTSGTYSGAMSGNGSFTKLGNGAVTLSGANTYSGGTTVSAGRLLVNGTLGNSAVTVGNAATLGGNGVIGSSVTVLSGGTLSPGNSPGLLTIGSLDLQLGSTTLMQIIGSATAAGTAGADYDSILISSPGGLGYGGALNLDFANLADFLVGTSFNLFSFTGSTIGHFASVFTTGSGSYAGLSFTGNNGVWTSPLLGNNQQLTFTEGTGLLSISAGSAPVPEIDPNFFGSAFALLIGSLGLLERSVRRPSKIAS